MPCPGRMLNDALKKLDYKDIDITYKTGPDTYQADKAATNRSDALNRLNPSDYVGTILRQGTAPRPTK